MPLKDGMLFSQTDVLGPEVSAPGGVFTIPSSRRMRGDGKRLMTLQMLFHHGNKVYLMRI